MYRYQSPECSYFQNFVKILVVTRGRVFDDKGASMLKRRKKILPVLLGPGNTLIYLQNFEIRNSKRSHSF
jgi:hypothetical protein